MRKLKFAIIGTRGIPANYGGFETFAEEVAKRISQRGMDVLVVGDANLAFENNNYLGINISKTKSAKPQNPLMFYKESIEQAVAFESDFILMCGVGGSIWLPLYSSRKRIIAVNPDGLGFKRDKYVWWKKAMFYSQYLLSSIFTEHLVCDSIGIQQYYLKNFFRNKNMHVIEYGTYINPYIEKGVDSEDFVKHDINYKNGGYHLIVARLEPENNVKMIIEGYKLSNAGLPLVVVGNTITRHSKELIQDASTDIHFIGGIYDKDKLQLLRYASRSYWHGHSVGGTNPSLLEAMGSANLCICHENIFNKEVVRDNGLYFDSVTKVSELFEIIERKPFKDLRANSLKRAKNQYSWERITDLYMNLVKGKLDERI